MVLVFGCLMYLVIRTIITACTLTALWLLTYGSIIGIWETGEVAELKIDTGSEEHQVRVWLLDVNDNI